MSNSTTRDIESEIKNTNKAIENINKTIENIDIASFTTTSLVGGRWESLLAGNANYKIDKFTGDVYVLVQGKDNALSWQLIEKIEKEENSNDVKIQDVINYQLFTGGSRSYLYLLNTNTGLTWQLFRKDGVSYFNLIE
jgi:hypothetical protein